MPANDPSVAISLIGAGVPVGTLCLGLLAWLANNAKNRRDSAAQLRDEARKADEAKRQARLDDEARSKALSDARDEYYRRYIESEESRVEERDRHGKEMDAVTSAMRIKGERLHCAEAWCRGWQTWSEEVREAMDRASLAYPHPPKEPKHE